MSGIAVAVVGGTVISGLITNNQAVASARNTAQASVEAALIAAGVSRENAILQAETALQGTAMQVEGAIKTALINAGVSIENANLQARTFMQGAEMKALGGAIGVAQAEMKFAGIQELLAPTILAGETAFTAQQALTGLGGDDAQREAITRIEQSPEFEAMTRTGEEAILAKGSATGGLRGGNVQAALAQFRPAVLSQLIENQYAKLQGIGEAGQAAAAQQAAGASTMATTIANVLAQTGATLPGGGGAVEPAVLDPGLVESSLDIGAPEPTMPAPEGALPEGTQVPVIFGSEFQF